jgi:hypothetical protein
VQLGPRGFSTSITAPVTGSIFLTGEAAPKQVPFECLLIVRRCPLLVSPIVSDLMFLSAAFVENIGWSHHALQISEYVLSSLVQ